MSDPKAIEDQATDFERIVLSQAEAALNYFREMLAQLEVLVHGLSRDVEQSSRLGRDFLRIDLKAEPLDSKTGHQCVELTSRVGHVMAAVNQYRPGELVVEMTFENPRMKQREVVWTFPRGTTLSGTQMGDYIIRSLTAPTDYLPE